MKPLEVISLILAAREAGLDVALQKQDPKLWQRRLRNPGGIKINNMAVEKRTLPILPFLTLDDQRRFWGKVDVRGENDCWIWKDRHTCMGYGQFTFNKGMASRPSRISFALTFGYDPMGELVCHKCDNPPCANPCHLFLGNNKSNQMDASRKGRSYTPRGELAPWAKLTASQVIDIRHRAKHQTERSLSKEFGLSFQQINRIVRRERWAHI